MPRINKLTTDTTLTGDDKLLGSDVSGATRNYKLSDVANFVQAEGGVFTVSYTQLTLPTKRKV